MFNTKKQLSPYEQYYKSLERQNLPWRILKGVALVLFVGLMVLALYQGRGMSGSDARLSGGVSGVVKPFALPPR
jgi:hypothetical protein